MKLMMAFDSEFPYVDFGLLEVDVLAALVDEPVELAHLLEGLDLVDDVGGGGPELGADLLELHHLAQLDVAREPL